MNEKESSKTKLIKTASRLFQLQGYHATGLNQITLESGAPKGSLYHHFPEGKEQLAMEAVKLTAGFVSRRIQAGLSAFEDPVAAIQHFITEMAEEFHREGCTDGVPIASLALESSVISDPLRKACQSAYEAFQREFTNKLLTAGYEETRARELGIVINAMVEGAFLTSYTLGKNEPLLLVAAQVPILLR